MGVVGIDLGPVSLHASVYPLLYAPQCDKIVFLNLYSTVHNSSTRPCDTSVDDILQIIIIKIIIDRIEQPDLSITQAAMQSCFSLILEGSKISVDLADFWGFSLLLL